MLLAYGLQQDPERRERAALAMKCLLLIKDMADVSRSVVVRNIHLLEESFSKEEAAQLLARAVELSDPLIFRNAVGRLLSSPAAFLSASIESR